MLYFGHYVKYSFWPFLNFEGLNTQMDVAERQQTLLFVFIRLVRRISGSTSKIGLDLCTWNT